MFQIDNAYFSINSKIIRKQISYKLFHMLKLLRNNTCPKGTSLMTIIKPSKWCIIPNNMLVFDDLEKTGYESQAHSRISQRPWWKDKGNASIVFLSRSRHGKVHSGSGVRALKESRFQFLGIWLFPLGCGYQSLGSCVWGVLWSLC